MPSQAELEESAKHVDYEIWMFMETAGRFEMDQAAPYLRNDDVLRRALFESCLLHFRALLEFFRTSKAEPDDLRAIDYMDDPRHKAAIENLAPNDTERARVRELHKALAHVVVGRDALNTDWSESDLRLVRNRLSLFFAWIPAPRLRWFPLAEKWFADSFKR